MRYNSDGKEQRRQRMFEKALDAAATSPYARHVTRWVLLGIGKHRAWLPHVLELQGALQAMSQGPASDTLALNTLGQTCLYDTGSGGRIAAVVGPRCRPQVAGCVLLSYPLMVRSPTSQQPVCMASRLAAREQLPALA
jgi:hypothetical protein